MSTLLTLAVESALTLKVLGATESSFLQEVKLKTVNNVSENIMLAKGGVRFLIIITAFMDVFYAHFSCDVSKKLIVEQKN